MSDQCCLPQPTQVSKPHISKNLLANLLYTINTILACIKADFLSVTIRIHVKYFKSWVNNVLSTYAFVVENTLYFMLECFFLMNLNQTSFYIRYFTSDYRLHEDNIIQGNFTHANLAGIVFNPPLVTQDRTVWAIFMLKKKNLGLIIFFFFFIGQLCWDEW